LRFEEDLRYVLGARRVLIQAPIRGMPLVGVTIPKETPPSPLPWRDAFGSETYNNTPGPLVFPLGIDEYGKELVVDLHQLSHLLVGGANGTGKSVFLHTLICSLLERNSPDTLQFILLDPKRTELFMYQGVPHLMTPFIAQPKRAVKALAWLAQEMERRFNVLEANQVRDIGQYHEEVRAREQEAEKNG
jgi:S-DNA-T family DNA segregation ATPase FtsK/SpoIIIE